jgi:putative alpha-1,2-mannosidase
LGVPYFEEIELSLSGNKVLTIKAEGVSNVNHIMTTVHFNGRKLEEPFIPIKELWEGGVLEFSTPLKLE